MTQEQFIDAMAQGIAMMEGFYVAGSIAQRNNNPGNLRSPGGGPYRVFSSAADGWAALNAQIARNLAHDTAGLPLSLYQFFAGQRDSSGNVVAGGYPGYAPAADANKPFQYAEFIASRLGIADLNAPISSFFDSGELNQGDGLPLEVTPVNLSDIAAGWVVSAGVPEDWARPVVYGGAALGGWLLLRALL